MEPVTRKFAVYRLVEVAEVVVPWVAEKAWRVEEAVDRKPFRKASVVEVACSLVESLVKGQEKVIPPEPQPVQEVTVKLPILAVFTRRSVLEAVPDT